MSPEQMIGYVGICTLGAGWRDAWRGWGTLGVAGPAEGTPVERALSVVCTPPLWQLLLLLLGLTAGLVLHSALAGAVLLSSALLLAVVDATTLRLPDVVTQSLLWLGLLFNLGATFVPLPDAVCGAVTGYLMLWCVNGCYRLVCRHHGLGAGDFKLLAALGAWLGWRALLLLLLAATAGLMCILCVRRWRWRLVPGSRWRGRCCYSQTAANVAHRLFSSGG
ncbi:MAG: prepilin peptidase [Sodalis sp. (in: enterobacteria)]|uniref:prepilin peptidase n=1 Tax=Sodalis sp. (in: enterobacteria) TaxID=1898979 RepID=UPI0039E654AB